MESVLRLNLRRYLALTAGIVFGIGFMAGSSSLRASESRGELYIISIGVDSSVTVAGDYDGHAHDALQVRQALVPAESLFRAVHSKVFLGRQATPAAVLASLLWLTREMNASDVAVLFFSAHGDTDVDRGYRMSLAASAGGASAGFEAHYLWGTEINDALGVMAGRQIVLVDSCRAGALVNSSIGRLPRAAYILACGATQFSVGQAERHDRPHGFFAIALCEGLAGLADTDADGFMTLSEIAGYVPRRARAFYLGQTAVVRQPPDFGPVVLARNGSPSTVQQLWTPRVSRNPFGLPDVPEPDAEDVKAFALLVNLDATDSDENSAAWPATTVPGPRDSIEGEWFSRWNSDKPAQRWQGGSATVKIAGERAYILYQEQVPYIIDVRRVGRDLLVGRYVNLAKPSDTSPWVGRIVDNNRIDGCWRGGRWDLRRTIDSVSLPETP